MRDKRPNEQTVKIELLSQWKLEAEFRNSFQKVFSACVNKVQITKKIDQTRPNLQLSKFY